MLLKKKNIAALHALTLLCLHTAQAQTAASNDSKGVNDGDTIQTVTVAGNYDNAIGTSNAASQGSVTANLISNRPALRTGELLEFVPGMIVTQHSGDGKANQYFLRGFNLDHGTDFATYVDGMPVNMRSHAHGQGYSDLNFLMPELVQRIDYKKGPYFSDEGDFASAGAAHIRMVDKLPQGIASLSLGSYGYQRAVLADSLAAVNGTLLYGLELNRNNGPWTHQKMSVNTAAYYDTAKARKMMVLMSLRWHIKIGGTRLIRFPYARCNPV